MAKLDISRDGKPLTIGAVCRILQEEFDDVSISKIRFLEDQNLVTPRRTPGGYRLYGPDEVDRLRNILRLQRDEFLPLRVIRQELQNGPTDRGDRPQRRRTAVLGEDRQRFTRDELIATSGADEPFVRELEDFGLITGSGPDQTYGDSELDVVRIALEMATYGLGPRHLKQFHTAVVRAAGLIDGVVAPALRSRNADRRDAGLDDLATLARLAADLTERILVREVSRGGNGLMHAVVTGAGTGIGQAIAERLARDGASLTLLARDADRLAGVAEPIGATALACDIRDRAAVDAAFAAAADERGPIHVLVANAGIGGPNDAGEEDRFDDLVATNLVGTYSCLRAAQRHFPPATEPRHLVVISSILARIPVPGYTGYSASKAGLLGLVRSLAAELAPDDVPVNAICPGWVDTTMAWTGIEGLATAVGISRDEAYERAMSEVPLRRMSQPADIAGVVAWLLSPDARGVTGQAIDVNGGAFMS